MVTLSAPPAPTNQAEPVQDPHTSIHQQQARRSKPTKPNHTLLTKPPIVIIPYPSSASSDNVNINHLSQHCIAAISFLTSVVVHVVLVFDFRFRLILSMTNDDRSYMLQPAFTGLLSRSSSQTSQLSQESNQCLKASPEKDLTSKNPPMDEPKLPPTPSSNHCIF
ncbi:hypothetical protein PGT21_015659 [Puccinia graminis f. sp. tritici]|uniref:Uncharacterized protein n=1 Tax=Puccinia graminis f. sp. tritici TaxID=56615 RepID=A0A5B0MWU4_PUCGR|nr:hypothetical protein PGT21_015659 [Puccinia graminis f. sp. tritici]